MGSSTVPYKRRYDHKPSMLDTLSAFLHRLLRTPMADNPPTLSEILCYGQGGAIPVESLTGVLRQAYVHAVSCQTFHPDRARICHISFMKEREGSQHEYVLAYVTVDGQPWADDSNKRLGVIRCERGAAENTTAAAHMKAASSNLSSSGSSTPNSSAFEISAHDRVTICNIAQLSEVRPPADVCLYEHFFHIPSPAPIHLLEPSGDSVLAFNPPETCPPRARDDTSPPSLYDLAAAGIALKVVAPQYILLQNQCYWFAAMIYFMLGGPSAADDKPVKAPPKGTAIAIKGKGMQDIFPIFQGPSKGQFHGLWQFVSDNKVLSWYNNEVRSVFDAKLVELYKVLREGVLEALQDRRAVEESRLVIAEKDLAIAEMRQTEEEGRRAVEEGRHAVEEGRRVIAEKDLAIAEMRQAEEEHLRIIAALKSQIGRAGPSRPP
ncbi:hypothetical protein BN946_scf184911.g46 [Trametes cinnabarina]|uniref:Uncharacterized protein n=1 Tax=Pycnoporus cinnabarinus TaxID=5643 RepID=A0A060SBF8_PYCCI|nr:hypothetical protein BN946_scf184911.g46 [Trametes cinnabarina]